MTRLILTTGDSAAGGLKQTGLAEIVIPFGFQFASGMLPSDAEIAMCLEANRPLVVGCLSQRARRNQPRDRIDRGSVRAARRSSYGSIPCQAPN